MRVFQSYIGWATISLMLINWGIEAYKWKILLQKIEPIKYLNACASVLSGLSIGFVTPHGVGDYLGRILNLHKKNKLKALASVLICRVSQLWITIVFGSVAVWIHFYDQLSIHPFFSKWVVVQILILLNIIAFVILFQFKYLLKYLKNKYTFQFINTILNTSEYTILEVSIWSMLRYFIFVIQFMLLLQFAHLSCDWLSIFEGICIIFLIKSVMPVLFDVGIREAVAVYIFSEYSSEPQNILFVSLILWLVNIVLPTIIGTMLVLKTKTN
jgi:hypothetical protein